MINSSLAQNQVISNEDIEKKRFENFAKSFYEVIKQEAQASEEPLLPDLKIQFTNTHYQQNGANQRTLNQNYSREGPVPQINNQGQYNQSNDMNFNYISNIKIRVNKEPPHSNEQHIPILHFDQFQSRNGRNYRNNLTEQNEYSTDNLQAIDSEIYIDTNSNDGGESNFLQIVEEQKDHREINNERSSLVDEIGLTSASVEMDSDDEVIPIRETEPESVGLQSEADLEPNTQIETNINDTVNDSNQAQDNQLLIYTSDIASVQISAQQSPDKSSNQIRQTMIQQEIQGQRLLEEIAWRKEEKEWQEQKEKHMLELEELQKEAQMLQERIEKETREEEERKQKKKRELEEKLKLKQEQEEQKRQLEEQKRRIEKERKEREQKELELRQKIAEEEKKKAEAIKIQQQIKLEQQAKMQKEKEKFQEKIKKLARVLKQKEEQKNKVINEPVNNDKDKEKEEQKSIIIQEPVQNEIEKEMNTQPSKVSIPLIASPTEQKSIASGKQIVSANSQQIEVPNSQDNSPSLEDIPNKNKEISASLENQSNNTSQLSQINANQQNKLGKDTSPNVSQVKKSLQIHNNLKTEKSQKSLYEINEVSLMSPHDELNSVSITSKQNISIKSQKSQIIRENTKNSLFEHLPLNNSDFVSKEIDLPWIEKQSTMRVIEQSNQLPAEPIEQKIETKEVEIMIYPTSPEKTSSKRKESSDENPFQLANANPPESNIIIEEPAQTNSVVDHFDIFQKYLNPGLKKYNRTTIKQSDIEKFIEDNETFLSQRKSFEDQKEKLKLGEVNNYHWRLSFEKLMNDAKVQNFSKLVPINGEQFSTSKFIQKKNDFLRLHVNTLDLNYIQRLNEKSLNQFSEEDELIITKQVQRVLNDSLMQQKWQKVTFGLLKDNNYKTLYFDGYREDLKKKKLVEIHNLDMNKCLDPKMRSKISKNKDLISRKSEDQKYLNSIDFRLAFYTTIHLKNAVLTTQIMFTLQFREIEDLIYCKMKHNTERFILKKDQQQKVQSFNFKIFINGYRKFCKAIGCQKYNQQSFLFYKNTRQLDLLTLNMSLFDIKTKTSNFDIYNEFEWGQLDLQLKILEKKRELLLKVCSERTQQRIQKLVASNFNARNDMYSNIFNDDTQSLLVNINEMNLQKQQILKGLHLRSYPFQIQFKVALLQSDILDDISKIYFKNRSEQVFEQMNVWDKNQKNYERLKQLEVKTEEMQMKSSFERSHAFPYVGKQDRLNFINLLFKYKPPSIQQKLCYPNQDYILQITINKIFKFWRHKKQKKGKLYKEELSIITKDTHNNRRKSLGGLSEHQLLNHNYENYNMFFNCPSCQKTRGNKSQRECCNNQRQSFAFKRQGALDNYDMQYQECVVAQKLEKKRFRVYDSMSIMYKDVYEYIDVDDQGISEVGKLHGYRVQFLRDPYKPGFLMEIFVLVKKSEGLERLKINEQRNHTAKCINQKKEREIVKKEFSMEKKKCCKNKKKEEKKDAVQKIVAGLNPDPFDTDDSMEGLDLEYLQHLDHADQSNSDNEENHDDEKCHAIQSQQGLMLFEKMKNQTSPIEYYDKLRQKREKEISEIIFKKGIINLQRIVSQQTSSKGSILNSPENEAQEFIKNFNSKIHQNKKTQIYEIRNEQDLAESKQKDESIKNHLRIKKIEKTVNTISFDVVSDNISIFQNFQIQLKHIYLIIFDYMQANNIKTYDEFKETNTGKLMHKMMQMIKSERDKLVKKIQQHHEKDHDHACVKTNEDVKEAKLLYLYENIEQGKDPSQVQKLMPNKQMQIIKSLMQPNFKQMLKKNSQNSSNYYHKLNERVIQLMLEGDDEQLQELQKNINSSDATAKFGIMNELQILDQIELKNQRKQEKKQIARQKMQEVLDLLQNKGYRGSKSKSSSVSKQTKISKDQKTIIALKRKLKKKQRSSSNDQYPWGQFQHVQLESSDEDFEETTITEFEAQMQEVKKHAQLPSFYKPVLINAIKTKNLGLMLDIIKRFQFSETFFDEFGDSLVAIASKYGDEPMVFLLSTKGFDVNTQNKVGDTPLHYAISGGWINVADVLINAGADEHVQNHQGKTCWELAQEK